MGMFDWLMNPVCAAIGKTPPLRQRCLFQLLTAAGYGEPILKRVFVSKLETILIENGSAIRQMLSAGGATVQLTVSSGQGDELSRIVLLALLKCSSRNPYIATIANGLSAESYAWCLSVMALARREDTALKSIDDLHYSIKPAEARTQVASEWASVLGVRNQQFTRLLIDGVFGEDWDTFASTFLDSTALAVSRLDQATLNDRARLIGGAMRGLGTNAVKLLCEVRFESNEANSDVNRLRQAIRKHLGHKNAPLKQERQPTAEKERVPLGYIDVDGTVFIDSDKSKGTIHLIGQKTVADVSRSMLMMLWLSVDQEGWSGPCLWVKDKKFKRVFVGFDRIKAISTKDAKDFARAFEASEIRSGKNLDQTKERFPIIGKVLQICAEGGFRIVE